MTDIYLLPHQAQFLTSTSRFTLLCTGIGGGKTFTGSHYMVNRVNKYPNALHFIGANTYSQLRNSTLSCMFGVLQDLNISFGYNQQRGILEFMGSKVLCASMENFNVLRGIEIGSFWLDEVRDTKQEAFDMLMGRLRDKNAKELQGRLTTSPSGYDWLFDYFDPRGAKNSDNFEIIRASSMENPHLPDGYLDSLKGQYSENFYKQEVLGEFINLTAGKVYYAFDRDKLIKNINEKQGHTYYIGMDFNVSPMTAVVCQVYDDTVYVVDEFFLLDSNTPQMARMIIDMYDPEFVKLIPDSTSSRRQTSGTTDFEILNRYGLEIMDTRNPFIMDRVNNVNRLLEQKRIIISPKCKNLINDLEKVSWKEGKNKIDESDKLLGHISDALGYVAHKMLPLEERIKSKTYIKKVWD